MPSLAATRGNQKRSFTEATIRELPTILEKFSLLHDGKLNNASEQRGLGRDFYHHPQCLLRLSARFKDPTEDEFIQY